MSGRDNARLEGMEKMYNQRQNPKQKSQLSREEILYLAARFAMALIERAISGMPTTSAAAGG